MDNNSNHIQAGNTLTDPALVILAVSPMPFYYAGNFHDGISRRQPKFCRDKCQVRDCITQIGKPAGHYICSKGFSCFPVREAGIDFLINGLIASGNSRATREQREYHKANICSLIDLEACFETIRRAHAVHVNALNQGARDSVAFLHDIRTSVGMVLDWCQRIIAQVPGASFEAKLGIVDQNTSNLFGSINLLREQLELADVIANPHAITYGPRRSSSLTGFWYRMVKLFEPRADGRSIEIRFISHGNEVSVETYSSFQFVPLILLDNAIKYSFSSRSVFVEITGVGDDLLIAVSSYGKTVPADYRDRIFDKHVRGPNGIEENPDGMGMGLYIAKQIIQAHGFDMYYEAPVPDNQIGNNKFVVRIPGALVSGRKTWHSRV